MLGRLFLLFTVVPLVELALLIRVGQWIGAMPTVGLVAGTGVVGAWLARRESTRSWRAVQHELSAGRVPGEELLHTLLVVLAGALLVTPGVLTDAAGLLTLARPVRNLMVDAARNRLARGLEEGTLRVFHTGFAGREPPEEEAEGGDGGDGWHRRPSSTDSARGEEGPAQDRPGRIVDV